LSLFVFIIQGNFGSHIPFNFREFLDRLTTEDGKQDGSDNAANPHQVPIENDAQNNRNAYGNGTQKLAEPHHAFIGTLAEKIIHVHVPD
jgi:hypothetical protein